MHGIVTLANDRVLDQLIALLNSIEVYAGQTPVCIFPYDHQTEKLSEEIARRPQVTLFNQPEVIQTWDQFARDAWDLHPTAKQRWQKAGSNGYHRFGTHRRFCAFDGPFDDFIYMDADTLLLQSVEPIFDLLKTHPWVVYDFQHRDLSHVYQIDSPNLHQVFAQERLQTEIFCSGFYAARKGWFDVEKRQLILEKLAQGEAQVLYPMAPDQTLLNYMVMATETPVYNLALELPKPEVTGCCVTSPHFECIENIVYDRGTRLTYLHYIGLSSKYFQRLCNGENIDFPYRDIFLHYRYHRDPQDRPQLMGQSIAYDAKPGLWQRLGKKLGFVPQ
jgi:hypothetical protein